MESTERDASSSPQLPVASVDADAVDRLLLELAEIREPVCVLEDLTGAITLALAEFGVQDLRSHHDSLLARRGLETRATAAGHPEWSHVTLAGRAAGGESREEQDPTAGSSATSQAQLPDSAAALAGARTVIWRLPKALDALRDATELIASHAAPDVAVYAGVRIKYLQPSVNAALAERFDEVSVSLAQHKSRVLTARGRRANAGGPGERFQARHLADLDLTVYARGGVFAGAGLDVGTRFLLSRLGQMKPDARSAVDLGCGSGIVAALLARERSGCQVWAVDESAAAIESAAKTAMQTGAEVRTVWDDGGESLPAGSIDLVVLNPPFHSGGPIDVGAAHHLIRCAGRLLAPDGELWTVYNSHLRHRSALSAIGPTEQIDRNQKFTLTRTRRRSMAPRAL